MEGLRQSEAAGALFVSPPLPNAMAREGSDFEEILTWYYTGTEVGELYGAAGE